MFLSVVSRDHDLITLQKLLIKCRCFKLIFSRVFQLVCLFLSLAETLHNVLHHHHQSRIVHCCVQWWMWVMWLSPGTKETVYCPASVCLISASVSLYLWRWNIRIKTPTAVCSTIPSATRPHIWTSLNSVTHVQVQRAAQSIHPYFFVSQIRDHFYNIMPVLSSSQRLMSAY